MSKLKILVTAQGNEHIVDIRSRVHVGSTVAVGTNVLTSVLASYANKDTKHHINEIIGELSKLRDGNFMPNMSQVLKVLNDSLDMHESMDKFHTLLCEESAPAAKNGAVMEPKVASVAAQSYDQELKGFKKLHHNMPDNDGPKVLGKIDLGSDYFDRKHPNSIEP